MPKTIRFTHFAPGANIFVYLVPESPVEPTLGPYAAVELGPELETGDDGFFYGVEIHDPVPTGVYAAVLTEGAESPQFADRWIVKIDAFGGPYHLGLPQVLEVPLSSIQEIADRVASSVELPGVPLDSLSPNVIAQLAGTTIHVAFPAWDGRRFSGAIISGDAYLDDRAIPIVVCNYQGPILSSADALQMEITLAGVTTVWPLTHAANSNGSVTLTLALTSTQSAVPKGEYDVHAFAMFGTDRVSLVGPNSKLKIVGR